jgi:hypothetical protein
MSEIAGRYCEVFFTPYEGSKLSRNIYGEFCSVKTYHFHVTRGPEKGPLPRVVESMPSNMEIEDFFDF